MEADGGDGASALQGGDLWGPSATKHSLTTMSSG